MHSILVQTLVVLALFISAAPSIASGGQPGSLVNESKPAVGALAAVQAYIAGSGTSGGSISQKLIGIAAKTDGEGVAVTVFNMTSAATLESTPYECHLHTNSKGVIEDAHCQPHGQPTNKSYHPKTGRFEYEDVETAIEAALKLFEKTVTKALEVTELKLWQNGKEIHFALGYGKPKTDSFMMCHMHGSHFDCHRRSQPGPSQP